MKCFYVKTLCDLSYIYLSCSDFVVYRKHVPSPSPTRMFFENVQHILVYVFNSTF